jgi:thiamine kinase-like enzyme
VEGEATGIAAMDRAVREIVEAMPGWSSASRLEAHPLPGGITNRNFRVDIDGASYVVRVPGARTELLGIDRGTEHAAARAAADLGVAPEVVAFLPDRGVLVTRFVEGEAIDESQMAEPATVGRVAECLRALHGGPEVPGTFSPFRVVERYREVAEEHGVSVPDAYHVLQDRAHRIERVLGGFTPRLCHNDLLNANFIRSGERLFIVDYEYAGMGDVFFDLANFSVNHSFDDEVERALLEAYFGKVTGRDHARLKLMRAMSDFREAMWGVVQQGLSTLDFDYVDYADRHFIRSLEAADGRRLESWLQEAA